MLAFEAELIHLPRSLIEAIWEALESLDSLDSQRQRDLRSRRSLVRGQLDSGCLHTWKSDA